MSKSRAKKRKRLPATARCPGCGAIQSSSRIIGTKQRCRKCGHLLSSPGG